MAAEVTEDWVADLDELLVESDVMQEGRHTSGGRTHIRDLRATFCDKMQVDDPDSVLYDTYQKITRSYRSAGLHPCNVIGNMLELTEIGGSVQNGIRLLQKGSNMLVGAPESLAMANSQMHHLAKISGWSGNVRQLLLDVPNLLRMGVARRAFIGRMAVQFGSPDLRQMNHDDIKRSFLAISVDEHLMTLMSRQEEYRFEETPKLPHRASYRSGWINRKLGDPEVVEFIGPKILRAYFRYAPPKPFIVRRYPYLAPLSGVEPEEEE